MKYWTGLLVSFALIIFSSSCADRSRANITVSPEQIGAIKKMHELDGVFLASQPTAEDLTLMYNSGVKTVVNLRRPQELNWDEESITRNLGMEYISVSFGSPDELTDDVFDRTRALLRDESRRPLLLHCGSSNRVGAVWLAHRVLDDGLTWTVALEEARTVGLRTPALIDRAESYVAARR